MHALLQPAAAGVLLRHGWHVYNEAVREGAACLFTCSAGIVTGFAVASIVLSRRDAKQQTAVALTQFWLSCAMSGILLFLCQVMDLRTSSIVMMFLSSAQLGTALPHVISKIAQNLEPETWMPLLAAALLAETICSTGEKFRFLQGGIPIFLFWTGLRGCSTTHSLRDVLLGIAGFFEHLSENVPVQSNSQNHAGNGKHVFANTGDDKELDKLSGREHEKLSSNKRKGSTESRSDIAPSSGRSHNTHPAPRKKVQHCLKVLRAEFQESDSTKIKGKKLSVDAPEFVPSFASLESTSESGQWSLRADAAEYIPSGDLTSLAGTTGIEQWDESPENAWNLEHGGNSSAGNGHTGEQITCTGFPQDEPLAQRAKLKVTAQAFVPSFTSSVTESWSNDAYEYYDEAAPYDACFADNGNEFVQPSIQGVQCF